VTYSKHDARSTDQELYDSVFSSLTTVTAFDAPDPPLVIIDYPCGLGKTTALISVLERRPDLKVLVVVQTLDEVDRIVSSAPVGRLHAPEGPGPNHRTKGEQLAPLVRAGKSIVITHELYERAGTLAYQGAFTHYKVIIDEVPNAVTTSDLNLDPKSFKEFYIDPGYCSCREDGLVVMTDRGLEEEERLKSALNKTLISNISSGRLYYDGNKHFIQTLPTSLFTHTDGVIVLTFLSEGSLFLKLLEKLQIDYTVSKSRQCHQKFQQQASDNLKIHRIASLDKVSFSFSKQTSYLPKSTEVRSVRNALKNLRQRGLAGVDLKNLMITCAKKNWYKRSGIGFDEAKPGLFSIDSRMFKGAEWLPNTTRGTNDYLHCTHAIYLYEQNVNPILLQWLDTNNAEFRNAYALTEMVQWLWRSQLRRGKAVDVYMPSRKMREIVERWMSCLLS
jgi:hypothetical protein